MSWEITGNANTTIENVGIGTTSPTDTLHVSKTGSIGGGISIQSSVQSAVTFMDKDGKPGWVLGRSQQGDDKNTFFLFDFVNSQMRMTVSQTGFVRFFTRLLTVSGAIDCNGLTVSGEPQEAAGSPGVIQCPELRVKNIKVTGDVLLQNADCAEDFDIANADLVEPGTVMVLGDEGSLHQSCQPYDKRVAGVISGAEGYKPGIVLDKSESQNNRQPVALLGKVYCKVDAQYAPVEVGDLLTTSSTPGHAMKVSDPLKAFGAVIGKALRPFREGQGLMPILIALQ